MALSDIQLRFRILLLFGKEVQFFALSSESNLGQSGLKDTIIKNITIAFFSNRNTCM